MSENAKCIVKGGDNHTHQGKFIGSLCAPCHTMITTGKIEFGNTFIHELYNKFYTETIREYSDKMKNWQSGHRNIIEIDRGLSDDGVPMIELKFEDV